MMLSAALVKAEQGPGGKAVLAYTSIAFVHSHFDSVCQVQQGPVYARSALSRVDAVLSAILDLCIAADGSSNVSPEILRYIGEFADSSSFKRIFRQGAQLKACEDGLDHAFSVFGVQTSLTTASEMEHFRGKAEERHEQLMQLLLHEQQSQFGSDSASQISKSTFSLGNSTTSFDLLPGKPKIFYGREEELQELVQLLLQRPARVAVLGPGGIGKTSLATAALHHPNVCAKYAQLFFISCESIANREDLIASLASHVGLPPTRNPLKAVLRRLAEYASVMLVLDNLETCWEPPDSRGPIEDLFSLLTDVETLGLLASIPLITMRGAERPGRVRWTRPCLLPLAPLSDLAAMQTFVDITDDSADDSGTMSEILQITDNLPLAISLVANIAAFEGHDAVLSRWQEQKTTLFSDGSDRRSNLDVSIQLSLSSPRMLQSPGAHQLLGLLSLLPECISEADLMQCKLPIPAVVLCKMTLIRTSFAYIDHGKRLRVLVPIREYFKQNSPSMPVLCRHLHFHFHRLIALWQDYQHVSTTGIAQRITANVGNFQAVLTQGLNLDEPDVVETIHGIIMLDSFFRVSGRRTSGLLTQLPPYMDKIDDHRLHGTYLTEVFRSHQYCRVSDPEGLAEQGIGHWRAVGDPAGEAKLLLTLSHYYRHTNTDIPRALEYLEEGLRLSQRAQNPAVQCTIMREISQTHWQQGRYSEAQAMAQEMGQLAQIHGLLLDEARAIRCDLLCRVSLGDLAP
ncbi:P-loop containing nucleoside triphosphate hydrolase protein [Roridomyces roridus]|uniref:P-loop containing nucleoside triphosphate hydrolase protein n=1 Tax=Roridomyces roridus TaxID=1738132 RepID=A0AAD7C1T9_9AGAR|nr:P-loop containing nucleoside triphosphate hydrolase protein [Roridomyces roridus]